MNEPRIEEQPYDDRHNTPPVPRNRVQLEDGAEEMRLLDDGDAHEDAVNAAAYNHGFQLPVRKSVSTHGLFNPPPPMPAFGTGLTWQASVQSPRVEDLASQDWATMERMPNVELHTLFAHLMVAAEGIRSEMRRRGMRVDL